MVNVSGTLCIGGLAGVLLLRAQDGIGTSLWAALVMGLLGSYTTVSSFSLQTLLLARSGEWRRALANVLLSLSLCLAAAALGLAAVLIGAARAW
jgi:fluoride exporter